MTLSLAQTADPGRVLYEPTSQWSPADCHRCGSPMERLVGPWADPDVNGNVIVDERDTCPNCGAEWPVLGDEWDRTEIRHRVQLVVAHRDVEDHAACDEYQPCRASRPGYPAQVQTRHLQVVTS